MNMSSKSLIRSERVQATLLRVISDALAKLDISSCIITRVSMTRDLKIARVYYIVSGKQSAPVEVVLQQNKRSIIKEVVKNFYGRSFPKISFALDDQPKDMSRIEELLNSIPDPID